MAEQIKLVYNTGVPRIILHCVGRNSDISRNNATSLWNLVPNSGLQNFATSRHPRKRCQLRWTVSAINWRCCRSPVYHTAHPHLWQHSMCDWHHPCCSRLGDTSLAVAR